MGVQTARLRVGSQNTDVQCKEWPSYRPTYQNCIVDCVINATCDELAGVICSNRYTGALETCIWGLGRRNEGTTRQKRIKGIFLTLPGGKVSSGKDPS